MRLIVSYIANGFYIISGCVVRLWNVEIVLLREIYLIEITSLIVRPLLFSVNNYLYKAKCIKIL